MPTSKNARICSRGHRFQKSSDCLVCPTCWSGYSRKGIRTNFPATLSAPALRALLNAGVMSLAQLSRRTESEIAKLHGMGPKGIRILKEALKEKKQSFRVKK